LNFRLSKNKLQIDRRRGTAKEYSLAIFLGRNGREIEKNLNKRLERDPVLFKSGKDDGRNRLGIFAEIVRAISGLTGIRLLRGMVVTPLNSPFCRMVKRAKNSGKGEEKI